MENQLKVGWDFEGGRYMYRNFSKVEIDSDSPNTSTVCTCECATVYKYGKYWIVLRRYVVISLVSARLNLLE